MHWDKCWNVCEGLLYEWTSIEMPHYVTEDQALDVLPWEVVHLAKTVAERDLKNGAEEVRFVYYPYSHLLKLEEKVGSGQRYIPVEGRSVEKVGKNVFRVTVVYYDSERGNTSPCTRISR